MLKTLSLAGALVFAGTPALAEETSEISLTGAEATARAIAFALREDPPAQSHVLTMATAAFASSGHAACEGAETRLIVLDAPGGVAQVYRLSLATDDAAVFTGGHLRVRIAADGRASEVERIGPGCERLEWNPADPDVGQRVAYLWRVGQDRPDPIDLWLSSRVPFEIGVVTPPYVWRLAGGLATGAVEASASIDAEP